MNKEGSGGRRCPRPQNNSKLFHLAIDQIGHSHSTGRDQIHIFCASSASSLIWPGDSTTAGIASTSPWIIHGVKSPALIPGPSVRDGLLGSKKGTAVRYEEHMQALPENRKSCQTNQ